MTTAPPDTHLSADAERTHPRHPDPRRVTGPLPAPEETDDTELARRFHAGDEQAIALAYRRWGSLVHTLARRSLNDERDAEDVTQQVFLAAWRGRERYRPERGALGGWLVGITRHAIADAHAARARRADVESMSAAQQEEAVRYWGVDESQAAVDRVLVLQKLQRLTPVQRRVLGMAVYGDMTQAQIAELTGLPLGTVKSHIRLALHSLRRVMEPAV
ncbi:sigma-70 family RNA polymerase sigma factor [Streptomyces sp. DSM 3412]|uniref:Sigma-70 family RNA polymerase sigma factor n=1 Tax=Streptomyces gottesmaniae TaxID=3075518 RepID=A0ABU2YVK0_9ACTN|nr:sigma-70 family RNA polymerase sigma factor [Streptomyces sp. DSM 3412]MDT0567242.1 sigma-70 family RNA polymerase sigma factor [Streptomyces sp. DSM 3412]